MLQALDFYAEVLALQEDKVSLLSYQRGIGVGVQGVAGRDTQKELASMCRSCAIVTQCLNYCLSPFDSDPDILLSAQQLRLNSIYLNSRKLHKL